MSNFDYGREQYCAECAIVNERRYNKWADPYSKPLIFAADNDNSPMKTCSSCECDLPHSEFSNGAVCRDCRKMLARGADRAAEYEARKAKRAIAAQSPAKVKAKRIQRIERANRKRVAEKRAMCRKIDAYLAKFNKPWTRPGLTEADKYRLRYANDNEFMLRERTRRRLRRKGFGFDVLWRMRQALNGEVGEVGTATIESALGYSMADLRGHLESLFVDGMSWEAFRRGEIHIDHKTPLSRFDLNDPAHAVAAWSLTNLQPLWAADNMAKGARTDEEWRASIIAAA